MDRFVQNVKRRFLSFMNILLTLFKSVYLNILINIHHKQVYDIMDKWSIRYTSSSEILHFFHYPLDPSGRQNPLKSYENCSYGGVCLQLKNGRLYSCARIAYIEKINNAFGLNFEYAKGDFININKLNRKIFFEFVTQPRLFCRYCNPKKKGVEWGHSNKSKEEWFSKY